MIKKQLLIAILCAITFCGFSQQASVTSGKDISSANGNISFSIGQPNYEIKNSSQGVVNEGVQQPFEILILSVIDFSEDSLNMSLYPNPSTDFIILSSKNENLEDLSFILIDNNGKIILGDQKVNSENEKINIKALPPNMYFLIINKSNKKSKTFKFLKK